jgi:hypothetical protein
MICGAKGRRSRNGLWSDGRPARPPAGWPTPARLACVGPFRSPQPCHPDPNRSSRERWICEMKGRPSRNGSWSDGRTARPPAGWPTPAPFWLEWSCSDLPQPCHPDRNRSSRERWICEMKGRPSHNGSWSDGRPARPPAGWPTQARSWLEWGCSDLPQLCHPDRNRSSQSDNLWSGGTLCCDVSGCAGCPILNFALFAKFRACPELVEGVGILEACPNQQPAVTYAWHTMAHGATGVPPVRPPVGPRKPGFGLSGAAHISPTPDRNRSSRER